MTRYTATIGYVLSPGNHREYVTLGDQYPTRADARHAIGSYIRADFEESRAEGLTDTSAAELAPILLTIMLALIGGHELDETAYEAGSADGRMDGTAYAIRWTVRPSDVA